MALDLTSRYPGRFGAKTSANPQGKFENETALGANDKAYLESDWVNDLYGFLGAILNDAGETPNNVIDTGDSSQFFDALISAMNRRYLNEKPSIEIIASDGTWNKPTDEYRYFEVYAIGGGGGGSSCGLVSDTGYFSTTGGGGGSGMTVKSLVNYADMPSSVAVTIGAGGVGASNATRGNVAGGNGGATSFGSIAIASGGLGALNDENLGFGGVRASPQTAVGDINMGANPGGNGIRDPESRGVGGLESCLGGYGGNPTMPVYDAFGSLAYRIYGAGGDGGEYYVSGSGSLFYRTDGFDGAVIIKAYK